MFCFGDLSQRRVVIQYCGNYQYRHFLIHISVIISLCGLNFNFSFKIGQYWFLINSCMDRKLQATASTLRRMIVFEDAHVKKNQSFTVAPLFFFSFFSVWMFGVQAEKGLTQLSNTAIIEMAATAAANSFLSILYKFQFYSLF